MCEIVFLDMRNYLVGGVLSLKKSFHHETKGWELGLSLRAL